MPLIVKFVDSKGDHCNNKTTYECGPASTSTLDYFHGETSYLERKVGTVLLVFSTQIISAINLMAFLNIFQLLLFLITALNILKQFTNYRAIYIYDDISFYEK